MAQFDFYCYSVQVFWSLLIFFLLYFLILQLFLTNISFVFKFRQNFVLKNEFTKKVLKEVNFF
jgi:F0F1-type ATP synthase membrane subunit b/b'